MLEQIIEKINGKGWNVYNLESDETLRVAIPRGPVERLEKEKGYVLLVRVSDPTDVEQVINAEKYLIGKGIVAAIMHRGTQIPLAGVLFFDEGVSIQGVPEYLLSEDPKGIFPYEEFYQDLDTLPATANPN